MGGTAAASAASAMPMAPVAAPALVEHVAWGCGPGWHPNHWGRCVPNRRVVYPGYYSERLYRPGLASLAPLSLLAPLVSRLPVS
ncbi:MAG: hypothetical protein E5V92_28685 [Mesorhizobium sp.]|nr:hypothetical protein EJ067_13110 [Mesorhizobium sp. M1D.F.Ca.ET.043.01.1.1]RWA95024.1 MAG: hypothetical protein EOQ32_09645 [Mesorhizobium sp.]RWE05513.1 MAG: hypothetical protein EOS61_22445 [Mesorhizobium sp.]TJW77723.1 MAG: hypothetical protein E5V92_28685 [Mesorhizobium sp.]